MIDRNKNRSISYSNISKLGILSDLFMKEKANKHIKFNNCNINRFQDIHKFETIKNITGISSYDLNCNNNDKELHKIELENYKRKMKLENSLKIGNKYFHKNEKIQKDLEFMKSKFKNNKKNISKINTINNKLNHIDCYDTFQKNVSLNYNEYNKLNEDIIINPLSQRLENYSLILNNKEKKEIQSFVGESLKKSKLNNLYSKERFGDHSNNFIRISVREVRKNIHELMKERDRIIYKKHLIFVKEFPFIEKEINDINIC